MKRFSLKSAGAALALALTMSSPLALAQMQPQHGPEQGAPRQEMQGPSGGMVHPMAPTPPHEEHVAQAPMHGNQERHWEHGQHYDGSRQVVSNWQHYHLRQPPHGEEWVQNGNQFVLIAVTSGIIADVIANSVSQ